MAHRSGASAGGRNDDGRADRARGLSRLRRGLSKTSRRCGSTAACFGGRRLHLGHALSVPRSRLPPVTNAPHLDKFTRVVVKVGSSLLVDRRAARSKQDWLDALVADIAGLHKRGADVLVVSSGAIALGRTIAGLPKGRAEARGQPGRRRDRPDRAGARVVAGLHAPRHRRRAGAADAAATPRSGAAISMRARRSGGSRRCARFRSSTRTTRSRPARSATATTTGSRPASPPWRARICWSCSPTSRASTPRRRKDDPKAKLIPVVERVTPAIEAMAGGAASELSRGGMRTKIEAARIATSAGTHMIIADGRVAHPIARIGAGGPCTWFLTPSNPVDGAKNLDRRHAGAEGLDHRRRRRGQGARERQEPAARRRHPRRGRLRARRLRRDPRRARRGDRPRPDRLRRPARRAHPRPQLPRHRPYPGHAGPRGDDPSRRHGAGGTVGLAEGGASRLGPDGGGVPAVRIPPEPNHSLLLWI